MTVRLVALGPCILGPAPGASRRGRLGENTLMGELSRVYLSVHTPRYCTSR